MTLCAILTQFLLIIEIVKFISIGYSMVFLCHKWIEHVKSVVKTFFSFLTFYFILE